jgi:hypothetical protein
MMKTSTPSAKGFIPMIVSLIALVLCQIAFMAAFYSETLFFVTMAMRDFIYTMIKILLFFLVEAYSGSMKVKPVMNEAGQTQFYCYNKKTKKMMFVFELSEETPQAPDLRKSERSASFACDEDQSCNNSMLDSDYVPPSTHKALLSMDYCQDLIIASQFLN